MLYPGQAGVFVFNAITVTVYYPQPAAVRAAFEQDGAVGAPYWARIWPAAIGLCRVLATHPGWVQDKQVLELGAGLGLPSLLAGRLGAAVHCTDASAEALPFVEESARLNGIDTLRCSVLRWQDAAVEQPDILLLSDVNYDPADFDLLYQSLLHFLQAGITILLSTPQRLVAKDFVERLLPFCREQFVETVEQDGIVTMVSVLLLKQ